LHLNQDSDTQLFHRWKHCYRSRCNSWIHVRVGDDEVVITIAVFLLSLCLSVSGIYQTEYISELRADFDQFSWRSRASSSDKLFICYYL